MMAIHCQKHHHPQRKQHENVGNKVIHFIIPILLTTSKTVSTTTNEYIIDVKLVLYQNGRKSSNTVRERTKEGDAKDYNSEITSTTISSALHIMIDKGKITRNKWAQEIVSNVHGMQQAASPLKLATAENNNDKTTVVHVNDTTNALGTSGAATKTSASTTAATTTATTQQPQQRQYLFKH